MKKLALLWMLVLLGMTCVMAQPKSNAGQDSCRRWRTQVDPGEKRISIEIATLSDNEIEEAIKCLLTLQGQRARARVYGDTRPNYNKADGYKPPQNPATIEIAALYYISYLFTNNWEHAASVVLVNDNGEIDEKTNTRAIVDRAFKSYREWFQKVNEIGLKKARELKLNPLEGSGVRWL
jgi:hypothetical protein